MLSARVSRRISTLKSKKRRWGIMKAVTREQVECRCLGEKTCKENREVKFLDGSSLPSIPYPGEGNYYQGKRIKNEHCHDCGCLQGKFHHPGCDMEICPRCKQQAINATVSTTGKPSSDRKSRRRGR